MLVAVGGGGLMSGVATAVEGTARVVAVEPVTAPTLHEALSAGEPVDVSVSGVAADSLGARRIGSIAWEVARRTEVVSVLVDDAAILDARRRLWDRYRLVLEAGACRTRRRTAQWRLPSRRRRAGGGRPVRRQHRPRRPRRTRRPVLTCRCPGRSRGSGP